MLSALCCAALMLPACGGSGTPSNPASPTAPPATTPTPPPAPTTEFTHLPIDLSVVERINPLGHMSAIFDAALGRSTSATLPAARIYMVLTSRGSHPVIAPAAGTVTWMLGPKPDFRIEVEVSPGLKYFVDHVLPEPGIAVGARVDAGQRIAVHGGFSCCLDFGVLNDAIRAGYINPRRYSPQVMNADGPIKYFNETLRSQLYSKVYRVADGLDGRHDYDRPGRLVGNWFLEGTPEDGALLPEHWLKYLVFAYSNTHPSLILVSITGTLDLPGLYAIQTGGMDPADVSVTSGLVSYRLVQKEPNVSEGDGTGRTVGVLLVQMLTDTQIRVEVFPGNSTAMQFTSGAKIYTR